MISFAVPAGAVPGPTYARFRLSSLGGLPPTGFAAPDGEVEDYRVVIDAAPTPTPTPIPPTPTPTNTDTPTPIPPTPTPTNTDTPTPIPPTPTPTNTPIPQPLIYVSSSSSGNAGDVSFTDDDILAFDPSGSTWSMYFDGSDVGLTEDLNGFLLLNDGSILITIKESENLPGVGNVDDSDIVRFFPTSLGDNTAGTFDLFFDGSDVGLTTNSEGIDAIGVSPDGRLVISTEGPFSVPGISGEDEDLLVFNVTSFGSMTSGSFDHYFDGSDVELSSEDVEGSWIDPVNNDIYLTVSNLFAVTGASGEGADIFTCAPTSLGDTTSCAYSLYWDGSAVGFGGENTDGLSLGSDASIIIPGAGPTPTPTSTPIPPTPTPTITPGGSTFTPTPIPPTPTPTDTSTPIPPTPTFTPVPPTPTSTNTPLPGADVIHVSGNTGGNAGGVDFKDEDILSYDTGSGTCSMYFDGSDVGLSQDLNGFTLLNDGSILMTFDDPFSLSGIGTVDNSDILQFFPTSLGDNTSGSFSLYFDGSDVGLSTSGENIDAIALAPDGRLVISTAGNFSVPGQSGADEDLLIFTATSFGSNTSGSFDLYFDGSDVDLSNSGEDVGGSWIDAATGEIYLSTQGNFSVSGASGASSDIFICAPGSLGSSTSCTFSFYWDGSASGFTPKVDGFFMVK